MRSVLLVLLAVSLLAAAHQHSPKGVHRHVRRGIHRHNRLTIRKTSFEENNSPTKALIVVGNESKSDVLKYGRPFFKDMCMLFFMLVDKINLPLSHIEVAIASVVGANGLSLHCPVTHLSLTTHLSATVHMHSSKACKHGSQIIDGDAVICAKQMSGGEVADRLLEMAKDHATPYMVFVSAHSNGETVIVQDGIFQWKLRHTDIKAVVEKRKDHAAPFLFAFDMCYAGGFLRDMSNELLERKNVMLLASSSASQQSYSNVHNTDGMMTCTVACCYNSPFTQALSTSLATMCSSGNHNPITLKSLIAGYDQPEKFEDRRVKVIAKKSLADVLCCEDGVCTMEVKSVRVYPGLTYTYRPEGESAMLPTQAFCPTPEVNQNIASGYIHVVEETPTEDGDIIMTRAGTPGPGQFGGE